jgi:hypothetical protein
VVAIVPNADDRGYRLVTDSGTVLHYGRMEGKRLYAWAPRTRPVVAAG